MKVVTPVIVAALVVLSVSAVGAVGTEALTAESGPTEIDSCTTINESGEYVITRDLTPQNYELGGEPCIQVTASDVVVDGQGHTVLDGVEYPAVRVNADDRRLSNVTVKNVEVGNLFTLATAIEYEGVDGGAVVNVTVGDADGVSLVDSSDIIVRESSFQGDGSFLGTTDPVGQGVRVVNTSGAVITANTFKRFTTTPIRIEGGSTGTTVASNRVRGCAECFQNIDDITTNTDPPTHLLPSEGVMIQKAIGTTVRNNTIQYFDRGIVFDDGNLVGDTNQTTRIANNTIAGNMIGVQIDVAKRPVIIQDNGITNNGFGIYTPVIDACEPGGEGTENVQVYRNDIANNSAYGILNERSAVLNATDNYWGATSGPSSANDSDAPFADPVTGTLADGEGDAVSEDPGEPSVSNVHFDPALNGSVANSSTDSTN